MLMNLTCEYVRSQLSAFHDEELPVSDHIAIASHLENCPSCAVEAADCLAISEALRVSSRDEHVAWMRSLERLQSDILQRLDAEENASAIRQFKELFDGVRLGVGIGDGAGTAGSSGLVESRDESVGAAL